MVTRSLTDNQRKVLDFIQRYIAIHTVPPKLQEIAEGIGIELRIIRVPGGKDPDECLTSSDDGKETFSKAIEEAPLLFDYQIQEALKDVNIKSHTGKIEAAKKVVPIVSVIKNAVARVEYIRQLAGEINIREEELLSDVRQYRRENRLDTETRYNQNQSFNSGYKNQSGQKPYGKFGSNRNNDNQSRQSSFKNNSNNYRKGGGSESYSGNSYRRRDGREDNRISSSPMGRRSAAPSGLTEADCW